MKNTFMFLVLLGTTSLYGPEEPSSEELALQRLKHTLSHYFNQVTPGKKPNYNIRKEDFCPVQILAILYSNSSGSSLPLQATLFLKKIEEGALLKKGQALPFIRENLLRRKNGTYYWKES